MSTPNKKGTAAASTQKTTTGIPPSKPTSQPSRPGNGSGGSPAPAGWLAAFWRCTSAAFLSPILWLCIVQLCLVAALYGVGYLSVPDPNGEAMKDLEEILSHDRDMAAHRALLAYSGVTLGVTWMLALLSVVWAVSALLGWRSGKAQSQTRRWLILMLVLGISVAFYALLRQSWRPLQPFPSALGETLLEAAYSAPKGSEAAGAPLGPVVPATMFLLAIVVPAALAVGASVLGEQIDAPLDAGLAQQVGLRLRELDYLLYIGALAMVFGTLQLSTTMSVPLASLPKVAELKIRLEMCKTLAPVVANSPFLPVSAPSRDDTVGVEPCRKLPKAFDLDMKADSLRQLVRSVTLAMGLSFSAMLVAIYVPSLVRLRLMVDSESEKSAQSLDDATKASLEAVGEVDPLRRGTTAAATLGPFIAGLFANAFGGS